MNKSFALLLLAIVFAACSQTESEKISFPHRFDRGRLDKLAKENKAIYDVIKRPDGTLKTETFYLGDSAKYLIEYDAKSNISEVYCFNEHGQAVWQENYYPNGQRKAHYPLRAFEKLGPRSVYHGVYREFYDNANISAIGEYKQNQLVWKLEYDKEGQAGDTMIYEYVEPVADVAKPDTPQANKVKPVEKINTATTPN